MKLLTASLEGKALDWALAVALNFGSQIYCGRVETVRIDEDGDYVWKDFSHTDHAVCLGLIERMNLDVSYRDPLRLGKSVLVSWGDNADFAYGHWSARGKTLPEAIARCVVAMQLGDEVDVPDDLCGQRKEGV